MGGFVLSLFFFLFLLTWIQSESVLGQGKKQKISRIKPQPCEAQVIKPHMVEPKEICEEICYGSYGDQIKKCSSSSCLECLNHLKVELENNPELPPDRLLVCIQPEALTHENFRSTLTQLETIFNEKSFFEWCIEALKFNIFSEDKPFAAAKLSQLFSYLGGRHELIMLPGSNQTYTIIIYKNSILSIFQELKFFFGPELKFYKKFICNSLAESVGGPESLWEYESYSQKDFISKLIDQCKELK